ncbi:hypothetical protein K0651_01805 [Ornithinimicrobium sp. Arc0846-15]|nr:hypothetical protein [Ornithinimicrobium laminariae]
MPRQPKRPFTLTSSSHAFVVVTYGMLLALGVQHTLDIARHEALTEIAGPEAIALWSVLYAQAALCALTGALAAPRTPIPREAMWVESAGCCGLVVTAGAYAASLSAYPWSQAATASTLSWAITLGAGGRLIQIFADQKGMRRALAADAKAAPAPLAKADRPT